MKTSFSSLIIGSSLLLTVSVLNAADDAVLSPAKRAESVAQAKVLLTPREGVPAVKNPFYSIAFEETLAASSGRGAPAPTATTAPAAPTGARTDRDLLQTIATGLRPNLVVMGGEPTLIFGQKRVKAGGSLTITFEGTEYVLEIVSIDRPNFTLRLNREEFTRPIK